jgi:hypothetical protein
MHLNHRNQAPSQPQRSPDHGGDPGPVRVFLFSNVSALHRPRTEPCPSMMPQCGVSGAELNVRSSSWETPPSPVVQGGLLCIEWTLKSSPTRLKLLLLKPRSSTNVVEYFFPWGPCGTFPSPASCARSSASTCINYGEGSWLGFTSDGPGG